MRVGVLGATGRMGLATCKAVLDAPDLELAAVVARSTGVGRPLRDLVPGAPEELLVGERLSDLLDAGAEVVVDFSRPEATAAAVEVLLPEGVHLVSGTTGLPAELMDDLAALAGKADHGNVVWAPNFALGAVLAMHFAAVAGRFYPAAEVIELHHQGKADAPSGTALRTARAIAAARERGRGPVGRPRVGGRGQGRRGRRGPGPLGPAARAGRPPGGRLRRPGGGPDVAPRLARPVLVHARGAAGRPGRGHPPRAHRRPRAAAGARVTSQPPTGPRSSPTTSRPAWPRT